VIVNTFNKNFDSISECYFPFRDTKRMEWTKIEFYVIQVKSLLNKIIPQSPFLAQYPPFPLKSDAILERRSVIFDVSSIFDHVRKIKAI